MSAFRRTRRYDILALAAAAALSVTLACRASHAAKGPGQPSDAAAAPQYYSDHVQPVLTANCFRCHAGMNHRGGLRLDSPEAILKGGKDGAVIVPGHPEQSLLIQLIRHEGPADDPKPMPPRSKLSDGDIAAVTAWVQAGARMPAVAAAEEKP
jgi:mono/diheme cytochrome c family protein